MAMVASPNTGEHEFYALCPAGFEQVVSEELKSLSIKRTRPLQGGVAFFGTLEDGLRACLWLRSASRVLCVLARVDARDADTLYSQVRALPWLDHIDPAGTLAVFVRGTNAELRNTQFSAVKVKDAICDNLRDLTGQRPQISKHHPNVAVQVLLHAKKATITIDMAGDSLHMRGYRGEGEGVEAPLKEALAAGMLLASPWGKLVAQMRAGEAPEAKAPSSEIPAAETPEAKPAATVVSPSECLCYDPFCGSGTLVLEAAMMAADMAPGILRTYWGFTGWKQFNPASFEALLTEADARLEAGLKNMPRLIGSDKDARSIEIARKQAARIGLASYITFTQADCAEMSKTLKGLHAEGAAHGCVVGNPPYGVRLMSSDLDVFYGALQLGLAALPPTWTLTAISPDAHFSAYVGAQPIAEKPVFNGAIESTIYTYKLGDVSQKTTPVVTLLGKDIEVPVISDHPDQFAARLRKNAKARMKWAKQHGVQAFRLYDADLPDYAVAIDLFFATERLIPGKDGMLKDNNGLSLGKEGALAGGNFAPEKERALAEGNQAPREEAAHTGGNFALQTTVPYLVVSEYQAPKSIDANKAYARFEDTVRIAAALLEIPRNQVFTRVRKQDRGGQQYALKGSDRKAKPQTTHVITRESNLNFELNLSTYLDVGLFLDHRITRQFVAAQAKDKDVLNLFAYTGSASVYAAAGGAKSVTTVDMSQTYLDWAKRNMSYNGFGGRQFRFINADVREWLRKEKDPRNSKTGRIRKYDLIFVDPPTFSNSKKMGKLTWDIQRDHYYLLRDCAKLLRENGVIVFSGNLRSFKLDEAALSELGFKVLDITEKTIPEDFSRNKKIHFCYLFQRAI